MKCAPLTVKLVLFCLVSLLADISLAQSTPTATQRLQLSTFLASSRVTTKLINGKNLDVTSGADLIFPTTHQIRPAIEVRGSYPFDSGKVDSQKAYFVGIRLEYPVGRLRPYIDVLIGRGRIEYLNDGYIFGKLRYITSTSVVSSSGVGLDYGLTHQIAAKVDFQYQRWSTPAISSGTISPIILSFGGVYTFDFNTRHHSE
jgi:hypothetical protein